jgi:hypothetical protein
MFLWGYAGFLIGLAARSEHAPVAPGTP